MKSNIWAIADLHLSLGNPAKEMQVFGPPWDNYVEKIEKNWREKIQKEDLILIAGDISWASKLEEAMVDLEWIDALPGTKLLCKGNHDHWWESSNKMQKLLPPSIHFIHRSCFTWGSVAIAGARLWDSPEEYRFNSYIEIKENPRQNKEKAVPSSEETEKMFIRELERLETSLKLIPLEAKIKIAMLHYPPIGAELHSSRASMLLEKYGIDICVFGHLHNIKKNSSLFNKKNSILYFLTSADYLNFEPLLLNKFFPSATLVAKP